MRGLWPCFRYYRVFVVIGLLLLPRIGLAAPPWRGVFFNPQVHTDPNFPWLLYYGDHRAAVRAALRDLHETAGLNLVDVFVLIPNSLRTPARGNRPGETVAQWANTGFLDNVARFVDDCHEAHMDVELDLVDNRWIPASIDAGNHIGRPGNPWWPVAGASPWEASAAWYRQVITYVEAHAAHPEAIAMWCMMGNYHWGSAEPVLWNDDAQPAIRDYTERFVKHVWPVFRAAGRRPKAAPILLPIFADNAYWRTKTPADRLAGFRNLKRWLVDDLKRPPDYWVMSTYPYCDPAPDGEYYLRRIVQILGRQNARRLVSTDLKGAGHESELRDTILSHDGRSGAELLRWHLERCREYGFAGWWMWAYQDTPTSATGLRKRDGAWKTDLLAAIREETGAASKRRGGPGAWPAQGALYEVSLEYYPNHSLRELAADMPRLRQLGVSVVYLTPIFRCLGTAQYLITDHYAVNPRYGTEADLHALVAAAHRQGIRLLLDLVTSLTYDGTSLMARHPDWILRGKDGKRQRYYPMPTFGWALDCAKPEVIAYFADVARHYVQRFGIDGWRVDSPTDNYDHDLVEGDHSRLPLLRAVRRAIDGVKPGVLLIGEVAGPTVLFGKPGSSGEPLFDEMLEASYDYPFCGFLGGDPRTGYRYLVFDGPPAAGRYVSTPLDRLVHGRMTSAEFVEAVRRRRIRFGRLRANFVENHDTARVATAFPGQSPALFVLSATLPGIPVIHAGQEIGSTVRPDASGGSKVVVDWANGDRARESLYGRVMRIRAAHPALVAGDIRNAWRGGDPIVAFVRTAGADRVLVALNLGAKPARCTVDVTGAGAPAKPGRCYELSDLLTDGKTVKAEQDLAPLELSLPPYGYRILYIRPMR